MLDRFFARDESYRVIGEALELPAGTIASRISRCLGKLREKLEGRKPIRTRQERRERVPIRRRAPGRAARLAAPGPAGWVQAAKELPERAARLDEIVERARVDAEFRVRLVADLEAALTAAGLRAPHRAHRAVRARLPELDSD